MSGGRWSGDDPFGLDQGTCRSARRRGGSGRKVATLGEHRRPAWRTRIAKLAQFAVAAQVAEKRGQGERLAYGSRSIPASSIIVQGADQTAPYSGSVSVPIWNPPAPSELARRSGLMSNWRSLRDPNQPARPGAWPAWRRLR